MAWFVFHGVDRPGAEALRLQTRESHRAHLREPQAGCRCRWAGPLVADEGEPMIGSLLILEADNRASAEAFVAKDPYTLAGLFARADISRWNWTMGAPE